MSAMTLAPIDSDGTDAAASPTLGPPPKPRERLVPSLHDEVLARLRDFIVEGNLAAGARVPERLLCERFGISRTPLREALKVLASEGLIELLPNRGARVRRIDERELVDLFDVMGGLEALAGRLACERVTEEDFAEIERCTTRCTGIISAATCTATSPATKRSTTASSRPPATPPSGRPMRASPDACDGCATRPISMPTATAGARRCGSTRRSSTRSAAGGSGTRRHPVPSPAQQAPGRRRPRSPISE